MGKNQLNGYLPSWIKRDERTNFNVKVFGFDSKQTPHAFSEKMFMDYSEFIKYAIKEVVKQNSGLKFSIVGHSIGCLSTLLIEDDINQSNNL